VLFIVFFMASLADALDLLRRGGFFAFPGAAGLFAWLAIALYNVTQDSFATPNIWLVLGIIAGVAGAHTPVFRSHSQLEA
jgi:hypothetical protein